MDRFRSVGGSINRLDVVLGIDGDWLDLSLLLAGTGKFFSFLSLVVGGEWFVLVRSEAAGILFEVRLP